MLSGDRLTGLRGENERQTYARAKKTLAVVVAPPSTRKPQPIPPSADWRIDLARGCPAHCQYCYLAGSLSGPPVTRVYANLDEVLDGIRTHAGQGSVTSGTVERGHEGTTFELSCYTDPLGIEHVTPGGPSRRRRRRGVSLRFGVGDGHGLSRFAVRHEFDDVDREPGPPSLADGRRTRGQRRSTPTGRAPVPARLVPGHEARDGRVGADRQAEQVRRHEVRLPQGHDGGGAHMVPRRTRPCPARRAIPLLDLRLSEIRIVTDLRGHGDHGEPSGCGSPTVISAGEWICRDTSARRRRGGVRRGRRRTNSSPPRPRSARVRWSRRANRAR